MPVALLPGRGCCVSSIDLIQVTALSTASPKSFEVMWNFFNHEEHEDLFCHIFHLCFVSFIRSILMGGTMTTRAEEIAKKSKNFIDRLIDWYSRRNFGMIIDPLTVMARNRWILAAAGAFETANARARSVNLKLKELAQIKAATMI